MSDTLIIIPTYNECENVCAIAQAILERSPKIHLLFVDDHSPDGTGALIDEMINVDKRVHIIHQSKKNGLGRAYIVGFQWALKRDYEFIFEMDADFSHNPKDVPVLRNAAENADLVLGSRYIDGIRVMNWPLSRLILSRGAGFYIRWVTGMPFTDPTGGFKCFRRCVLEAINLNGIVSNGYSFQVEMTHSTWRMGCRIVEVPIVFEERHSGASKMSKNIIFEAFWIVWKLLFRSICTSKPPYPVHEKINVE